MRDAGIDAVIAASPGLVAFLSGHVMPAQLANPSRDGRLEKPTICIATRGVNGIATIGNRPEPATGVGVSYGEGGRGLSDGPDSFDALCAAAKELGLTAGRIAVEMSHVPAAAVDALRDAAPRARLEPLNDLLRAAKAAKSASELSGIADALALCDAGQEAVRSATAPGRSELDLYSVAVQAMNAQSDRQVLALGELQVGSRGEQMAGFPTAARVNDGELVMCDLAPRHPDGWWGDSCLTVACGDPPEEVRRDWSDLRDGMEAAREAMKPGVSAGAIHAAVVRHVPDLPGHAGHGIGRDHYEEPIILPGNPEPLERDSVIVIEPGKYGSGRGMRIEHAYRVSEDGGIPLSNFSLEL
jgi:Xaa-Pro dipeptidase